MLLDKLKSYASSSAYPMHMPGHKRRADLLPTGLPYDIDVTEIYDFDDLHNPENILLDMDMLAAKLYGSKKAFSLVNGSTVGILSAIGAHTSRGDRILVANQHHWSIDNAAELFGLTPVYVSAQIHEPSGVQASIEPACIEKALLEHPDIKLVVITSPSYEGVVSDISAIAKVVHRRNIPLFVDSAHGAHFGFSKMFPESAIKEGADIVVMSLHKTLPALTQCSLLHLCSNRANADETRRLLSVFQTSSPSYVLMASIDSCLRLLDHDSAVLFENYEKNIKHFSDSIVDLNVLSVLCHGRSQMPDCFYSFDPGKLVVVTKGTSLHGPAFGNYMRFEENIEIERSCDDYSICMTSICDSSEGFERFAKALINAEGSIRKG